MFGNAKNKKALEQIESLKADLEHTLYEGLSQIKIGLGDLNTMRAELADGAKQITEALEVLRKDLKESSELIKLELRFPQSPSSLRSSPLTMAVPPPMGSREMVEYWGGRMSEARFQRTQAMAAYQESLKGKK